MVYLETRGGPRICPVRGGVTPMEWGAAIRNPNKGTWLLGGWPAQNFNLNLEIWKIRVFCRKFKNFDFFSSNFEVLLKTRPSLKASVQESVEVTGALLYPLGLPDKIQKSCSLGHTEGRVHSLLLQQDMALLPSSPSLVSRVLELNHKLVYVCFIYSTCSASL